MDRELLEKQTKLLQQLVDTMKESTKSQIALGEKFDSMKRKFEEEPPDSKPPCIHSKTSIFCSYS
jgi:hypothetical protein